MKDLLARSWWMFAGRGAVALLFGVLALVWPGLTLLWLVAMFAAYAIFGGGAAIVSAVKHRQGDRGWSLILLWGVTRVKMADRLHLWLEPKVDTPRRLKRIDEVPSPKFYNISIGYVGPAVDVRCGMHLSSL